jgi:two-component system chemotaxis response regulator CheB
VETALWSALRALEERAAMLRRIAQRMSSRGHRSGAGRYARNADQTVQRALVLRQALHALHAEENGGDGVTADEPVEQVP